MAIDRRLASSTTEENAGSAKIRDIAYRYVSIQN
jgi:hypothetical protein